MSIPRANKLFSCWALLASFWMVVGVNPNMASSDKGTAVDEALRSLRKINSAINVGVTYSQYGPLVIDAKALVDEALLATNNNETKSKLNTIMGCYADALSIWNAKVQYRKDAIFSNEGLNSSMIKKWGMPTKELDYDGGKTTYIEIEDALQFLWAKASKELSTLAK